MNEKELNVLFNRVKIVFDNKPNIKMCEAIEKVCGKISIEDMIKIASKMQESIIEDVKIKISKKCF